MTVKPVQKSEGDYVRAHVTSANETLVRLLWVTKSNKKTGRPEARLLCLTRYRVLTFKGKSAPRQNGHLYDLKTLVWKTQNEVELHFKDWFIRFHVPGADKLVKLICETVNRICCRWPRVARPVVDSSPAMLASLHVAEPFDEAAAAGAAGFLASYEALCSLHGVQPLMAFRTKLLIAFAAGTRALRTEWHGDKIQLGHVQAVAGCVLHDKFFTDCSFGLARADKSLSSADDVASTVGPSLSCVTHLRRLSFAHGRLGPHGAEIVLRALTANRKIRLDALDFSHNNLNDRLVGELAACLTRSLPDLRELRVANVGMTARGLGDLLDSFIGCKDLSDGLKVLSLGGNALGKKGTQKLAEYFACGCGAGLRHLDVAATGVDLGVVGHALSHEGGGAHVPLVSLAIGGNKLSQASSGVLAKFLAETGKVTSLDLSGMVTAQGKKMADEKTRKEQVALETIVACLLFNQNLERTALTLNANALGDGGPGGITAFSGGGKPGPAGGGGGGGGGGGTTAGSAAAARAMPVGMGRYSFARKLAGMCRASTSLVRLDVAGCALGDGGLALLLQGFAEAFQPHLEHLQCGRNSRVAEDNGAAQWLGRLVENCHHLHTLGVPGGRVGGSTNPKHRQAWALNLTPLWAAVAVSKSLEVLDVSCNELQDADVTRMCGALRSQTTRLRVIRWGGNPTTFQALRSFANLLPSNTVLCDIGDYAENIGAGVIASKRVQDMLNAVAEKLGENTQAYTAAQERASARAGRR